MNKDYKLNVSEIFASLCRHLTASGGDVNITASSREFAELSTGLEKVNFAHTLLKKYGLFPEYNTKHWKNNELSMKYRESGNLMYKSQKYDYALELYTKCITYAEENTELIGLGFGNRSAALFEKKMYKECIEDLERALSYRYSKNIRDKLERRLKNAKKEIVVETKYFEDLPTFTTEVCPNIASAANYVSIQNTSKSGRHVVATRDIQIGDVIAIEKPYAAIVLPEASLTHCHNCLKLSYNLLPCKRCNYALFCTEQCAKNAYERYHRYECPVLEVLMNLQISKLSLLALRVVICARNHFEETPSFKLAPGDKYQSERYDEIHNLCSNFDQRSNADVFERAITTAIIYEIVRKYTFFFSDFKSDDQKYSDTFKTMLLHHIQTAPSNFHEISELVTYPEKLAESFEIGAGAYSFLSMLNHSCNPNVVRHCHGTTIVLRALSPIKKGNQLFDNYGYHYALMPKDERRKTLKTQYYFNCLCEACEYNWPLYHNLPDKNFTLEVSHEDIDKLQRADVETAHRIVKNLLIKAAILDKMKPCKNLADIQECLKQCYSIMGNKRSAV